MIYCCYNYRIRGIMDINIWNWLMTLFCFINHKTSYFKNNWLAHGAHLQEQWAEKWMQKSVLTFYFSFSTKCRSQSYCFFGNSKTQDRKMHEGLFKNGWIWNSSEWIWTVLQLTPIRLKAHCGEQFAMYNGRSTQIRKVDTDAYVAFIELNQDIFRDDVRMRGECRSDALSD